MTSRAAALLALLALAPTAAAQPVNLAETPKAGDCARYSVELNLTGRLIVVQEGKPHELQLDARGRHRFAGRTLAAADGLPARSARHYDEANVSSVVGGDKETHTLPADRRLVVAQRTADGAFCYCPAGPVARDELDLIAEHFDPHCLAGLLPGKAVNVGDTWPVGNAAAQVACLYDGLTRNDLTGKLVSVEAGIATFSVTGTTEGIENGAKVSMTITATGTFHVESGRVTALTWKQADDREQGPVTPASKVEATVTLKREVLAQPPAELADAALAGVPAGDPPPHLTHLRYADPRGRYRFTYPRDWHVTGQTDAHLVLRLLDRGEFVAQATVGAWAKAEPGKHATPEEFKKAVGEAPGWTPTRVVEDGEVPAAGGRWVYRVLAEGKMDGQPAVQAFHLLAGPAGDQVAVTFALKPEKVKALGTRDLSLVNAIEFGTK